MPLRRRRSAFVALYGFVYGSVDKAVYALAVGFCVGFDNIFLTLWKTNKHLIIGLIFVTLNAFVAIFSAQ